MMIHTAKLPAKRSVCGPVTTRHIARFLLVYAAIVSIGLTLFLLTENVHLRIFGLGLAIPSGGFFAHAGFDNAEGWAHAGMATLGILSFMTAVMMWFGTGNVLAPLATWLFLAVAASTMKHSHIHPMTERAVLLSIASIFAAVLCMGIFTLISGLKKRRAANVWLSSPETSSIASTFTGTENSISPVFTSDDLKRMRFLLDRALQPVANFDGFEWRDQFQTAAIRYQLNFMGYALSMAQATHFPAFGGYMHEAQRRLIEKQTDHRVWRYWELENLWGNLRHNADPGSQDNIMFTGLCATQMTMYHAATGRHDYDKTGSFSLRHPSGKIYDYNLPSLVRVMERDAKRSAFHLIACEPNWIYPLCNAIGAAAVRAHAPDIWNAGEPSFRHHLEHEFIDIQGRFIPCRSRYTGLALPSIGGAMPQALPCFFLNATLPDIALRQWLLLRRRIMDGKHLRRNQFWRIDTGNYGFSRASAYTATALAAAELGDEEVKKLCLDALDEECPLITDDGHYYRPKASVWSHAVEFFARSAVKDGFRNLCCTPRESAIKPHIQKAKYPDVLVASAIWENGLLKAVLYPGGRIERQEIGISGLIPGLRYACRGTQEQGIIADTKGDSITHVMLNGRIELEIKPII